jgi:Tol biopolymer transport system component
MIYVQTDNQSNIQGIEFDSEAEKTIGDSFWITRGDRELVRAELSPDGKRFVMRQTRRTQDDIVVFDRDSGNWRDVTNDAPFDRYPRWSPDGKQIAFASDRNEGMEVWVSDADGSNMRQVTFLYSHRYGSSFPAWSPDGKSLIYTNNLQPYLVDLTKSWQEQQAPQKVLTAEPDRNFVVWDWSPDGKKLIGTLPLDERAIAVYSFETKRLERIVEDVDSSSTIPSWLPDNRRIVFAKENKIFITDTETKKTKEIFSHPPDGIRSPFVSRDGRLLYYIVPLSESNIWLLDGSPNQ